MYGMIGQNPAPHSASGAPDYIMIRRAKNGWIIESGGDNIGAAKPVVVTSNKELHEKLKELAPENAARVDGSSLTVGV